MLTSLQSNQKVKMENLFVVSSLKDLKIKIPNVKFVGAKDYISNVIYQKNSKVRVFNLCDNSYQYQSIGYYVSLMAEARRHKPMPNIANIRDMHNKNIVKLISVELNELIQKSFTALISDTFTLSIYFGQNLATKYERLCKEIFQRVHIPILKCEFERNSKKVWNLVRLNSIGLTKVPESHNDFIQSVASDFLSKSFKKKEITSTEGYDLAILYNPNEKHMNPSNDRALKKFVKAGQELGMNCDLITKDDLYRISEYDALFIRETTSVNHYTFKISRFAEVSGLVVIDDPSSIIRCANKVYLAETLDHYKLSTIKSILIHKGVNLEEMTVGMTYPKILKLPDSSFSQGVKKVSDEKEFLEIAGNMLKESDLVIMQEFLPTDFDWRIGVLNGEVLFVCRYYMVKNHWQIIKSEKTSNKFEEGNFDCIKLEDTNKDLIKLAVESCSHIGNGFYGVDIKEVKGKFYIVEINDNPNLDAGVEDTLEGFKVYQRIMAEFLKRIKAKKGV